MGRVKAYYLKRKKPAGCGYHRVEATSLSSAIRKFTKNTKDTRKDVYVKKRIKKDEKRNYIPPQKAKYKKSPTLQRGSLTEKVKKVVKKTRKFNGKSYHYHSSYPSANTYWLRQKVDQLRARGYLTRVVPRGRIKSTDWAGYTDIPKRYDIYVRKR